MPEDGLTAAFPSGCEPQIGWFVRVYDQSSMGLLVPDNNYWQFATG